MRISSVAVALSLAVYGSARQCHNITVSVDISARNGDFDVEPLNTTIEVTDFVLGAVQQGRNASAEALNGYTTVSGTYDLATTYCTPDNGPGSAVQLLTHGIGFDRSYWDIPFKNYNYSYVNVAVDEYGYDTLSWDRLGIGMSARGDPIQEIQAFLEIAALTSLAERLRDGSIEGVDRAYDSVALVGHSFGSIQSFAVSRERPELVSNLVLTGYSSNATYLPDFQIANNFMPVSLSPLADQYPIGYFVPPNPSAVHVNFFGTGQFDPEALDYAFENGQPVSQGELLSFGGAAAGDSQYAGPVLVITGDKDLPFCGASCSTTGNPELPNILETSRQHLPNASPFEAVVVPGAGHGLNFEYSHTLTYSTINDFLDANRIDGPAKPKRGYSPRRGH